MTTPGENPAPESVDALQAEIQETREELAGTVDALSAKLDVGSRVRARATDWKQRAEPMTRRPAVLAAAGVALVAAIVVVGLRRRRR